MTNIKDLISIDDLSKEDILHLLDLSNEFVEINKKKDKKNPILKGQTVINLFFENSTRTKTSFELAGKRLGADVININVSTSAVKKGETLIDTAQTLNAMHPDFIVVRHSESGAVHLLAKKVNCSVINAGDGMNEHPTQALLDALAIKNKKGYFEGLKVVICGDILHSRVARSNVLLLKKLGADIHLVAPPTLIPKFGFDDVKVYHDLNQAINDADIIMVLRLQLERMNGCFIPSIREYFHFYGIDYNKLSKAKKDSLIMHPGPINRGIEIDTELADNINRSIILDQVEMGIAVRQAVLKLLKS